MRKRMKERGQGRQRWMAEYHNLVAEAKPELAGRICWDTAAYFYTQGITPADAAKRYTTHEGMNDE